MTKKITAGSDGGDDSTRELLESSSVLPLPFRITKLERIGPYRSKIAVGRFEIEGFGDLGFEVFLRDDGLKVAPEAVLSRFTGAYTRTYQFEPDFRASLTEAVRARLEAESALVE